jgi:large subunit ribosomal protein L10
MSWEQKVRFEETNMPRPEKVQAVADIKERIEGAQAVFLAEYAGLSVKQQQELRRTLRENGAEFKVVKMSLTRLAAADLDIDALDELLLGPTGLAFADDDPAGAAKVLKDFAKSHETFVVKGGLLGLEFLPPEKIAELADLEPREVLLAKLAGVMQAPMANLARLLVALPRNTANALSQLLEKKEAEVEEQSADSDQPSAEGESQESDAAEVEEAAVAGSEEADSSELKAEEAEVVEEIAEALEELAETEDESDDASADTEVAAADATADADTDEEDQASADAVDEE